MDHGRLLAQLGRCAVTWTMTSGGYWGLLDARTEECWELLDEVRALEDVVAQRDAELDVVREQLALEISRRCLGGSPPGYSNSKFTGPTPPPYTKDKSC